ncbi:hypothetical protein QCA50_006065 [Cerrena zonata]|uniref:HIT domain-containing protein n=1 Tax=Cerrena zonata TaxID=2478898 RepID=A0AAW0GGU4_9APHY
MWKTFSSPFRSCVGTSDSDSDDKPKCFDRNQCIFCDVSMAKGFDVLWEDDEFVAFRDHNPSTKFHFLVVPKQHYGKRSTSLIPFITSLPHDTSVYVLFTGYFKPYRAPY